MSKRKECGKRIKRRRFLTVLLVFLLGVFLIRSIYGALADEDVLVRDTSAGELSDEIVPGKLPMFFQTDNRWKDISYGDGTMELTGCGPTCLSMVLCGLNQSAQYDPVTVARFAQKDGYYAKGAGSSWTLMSEGAQKLGLIAREVTFDRAHIISELQQKRPIISVMGPGDFTTTGHYIVLCEIDLNNMVTVHDPNSRERSERKWSLDQLMSQMKNLWSYRLKNERNESKKHIKQ